MTGPPHLDALPPTLALFSPYCAMGNAGEEGDGEEAELSLNVPAGRHFSVVGFGNAFTMAR